MKRSWLAGATALGATLLLAPSALASTATIVGGNTIKVTASENELNRILVTYSAAADTYVIADSAATIAAGGICTSIDSHSVSCLGTGITLIDVDVGRASDRAELDRNTIPAAVEGKLDGDRGNDVLLGANGPGDIRGGSGRDLIDGRNGADDIHGGSGTDTLVYPPERTTTLFVTVGSVNDNDGNELDQTGARRDTVHGDIEVVFGAAGSDFLVGDKSAETLVGGPGNDLLFGMRGNDTLIGGDGNDLLFGMRGNETLLGQLGDDLLSGGSGNDTARGGFGTDRVLGGPGNDRLVGGADNDFVRGKKGHDVMNGNTGIDVINAKDGFRDVKINCGPGPRRLEWAKRDKRLDPRRHSC